MTEISPSFLMSLAQLPEAIVKPDAGKAGRASANIETMRQLASNVRDDTSVFGEGGARRREFETSLFQRAFAALPPKAAPLSAADRKSNNDAVQAFIGEATRSAGDKGGVNEREQAAISDMRAALSRAADHLKPEEMHQLMSDIRQHTGSVKHWGGRFEDGGYRTVVDLANGRADQAVARLGDASSRAATARDRAMQLLIGMLNQDAATGLGGAGGSARQQAGAWPFGQSPQALPPLFGATDLFGAEPGCEAPVDLFDKASTAGSAIGASKAKADSGGATQANVDVQSNVDAASS
jgi:hypothetical protein